MINKPILSAALALSLLLLPGCGAAEPLQSGSYPEVALSGWVVNWEEEAGWKALDRNRDKISMVSWFAVHFGRDGHLHPFSQNFRHRADGKPVFLTIVNDVEEENGQFSDKDTVVLEKVLATEQSRRDHVKEILHVADVMGADGIDIDYERIGKNPALLDKFADFTRLLSLEARTAHKEVRVILEPSIPMNLTFSTGPTYVVMCYNLHGLHNGPGPKADRDFILKTLKKMEALPGKKAVAFSGGGCRWEDASLLHKGKAKFITGKEAAALAKSHGIKPERDGESAALHFQYEDKGHTYDVWYADKETMAAWVTLAARHGIQAVSLWRLGDVEL